MADGGGMGGFLGEVGQVVKQQGQKVAGQISGQVIKQVTGNNNQTPAGQSPKTTTGIDLVDFGKVATGQLMGNKSTSNATPQSKTSGLGTSIFGNNKKAGVFNPSKQSGWSDSFGGEFNPKKAFGFGAKKPSGQQTPNQAPDFSEDEIKSKRKLEELRKKLFDETYGQKILELGKTDEAEKKREEEQKAQEEERKKREEEQKAQEEENLDAPQGKQKKGLGAPRNKKSGFNFMKWLKPKRQSNESSSGNRA